MTTQDHGMTIWIPILSALVSTIGVVIAASLTIRSQRQKMEAELSFQRQKFRDELTSQKERLKIEFATENSVESALRHLLGLHHLAYRSFPIIRHHIGGFEANELRRLLVRAGAVRFMAADGTELWAMRDRVIDDFKLSRWKHPQSPQHKIDESELFPAVFKDKSHF